MSSGSKGRRPRNGSLGFYHNSRRGIRVPSVRSKTQEYFEKIGMTSLRVKNKITLRSKSLRPEETTISRIYPVTILKKVPSNKIDENRISLMPRGKKLFIRQAKGRTISSGEVGKTFTVIGYTKPLGIIGPCQRWGVKLGKRKCKGSGTVRHAGCMGVREPGAISWKKPFGGRDGGNRRTIRGNSLLEYKEVDGEEYFYLKGSTPGKKTSILALV